MFEPLTKKELAGLWAIAIGLAAFWVGVGLFFHYVLGV